VLTARGARRSVVVGAAPTKRQAAAVLAAKGAALAALRALRAGARGARVTEHVQRAALARGCRAVDGAPSRRVGRNDNDGDPGKMLAHREEQVRPVPRVETRPSCEHVELTRRRVLQPSSALALIPAASARALAGH